jgi:hypothetical protein
MFELYFLYRLIKAVFDFVDKNFVALLIAGFLILFLGFSVGSFCISAYLLLKYFHDQRSFDHSIWIALILSLLNFWALTSDFYKDFPGLYKLTICFNVLGLFLSVFYLTLFIKTSNINAATHTTVPFILISCFILLPALVAYNALFHVTEYITAKDEDFAGLLQQQKRNKYQNEFNEFERVHQLLNAKDYYNFNVDDKQRHRDKIKYGETIETPYETNNLIIMKCTSLFHEIKYTDSEFGGVSILSDMAFLNGMDADYNNGNITYKKDITGDIQYGYVEAARERHEPVYTEVSLQLEVIPDNIDYFIAYKEGEAPKYNDEVLVSEDYLRRHDISITPEKW